MSLKYSIRKALKRIQYSSPLRKHLFYRYEYFFHPCELWFLCECAGEALNSEGCFLEVGCARGATTVYLNRHIDHQMAEDRELEDRSYHCIDTFSGFCEEQVDFETKYRGKKSVDYSDYSLNDKKWFDEMLATNSIDRVISHEADAAEFDYETIGQMAFVLLDVDLYLPTKSALEKIYPLVSEGGIIIVDDCKTENKYDGAEQAFREFVADTAVDSSVEFGKFGVIRK